jgi:hypothetical protein
MQVTRGRGALQGYPWWAGLRAGQGKALERVRAPGPDGGWQTLFADGRAPARVEPPNGADSGRAEFSTPVTRRRRDHPQVDAVGA